MEQIDKKRHESSLRLRSAWESILDKYGGVGPEEDDEIDLVTFKVKRCTGHLVKYSEQNKFSWEEWEDEESFNGVDSDDGDEESDDELGRWDEKSGLDDQDFQEVRGKFLRRPWNEEDWEDKLDRAAFLRDEAKRREALGHRSMEDEDESTDWQDTDGDDGQETQKPAPLDDDTDTDDDNVPLFLGKRRNVAPSEEEDDLYDSADELVAQTSEAEEATSVVYLEPETSASPLATPTRSQTSGTALSWSRGDRQRSVIEVEVPPRAIRGSSSMVSSVCPNHTESQMLIIKPSLSTTEVSEGSIDPSLAHLFISSPSHSPVHFPVDAGSQPIAGPSRIPYNPGSAIQPSTRPATQASELDSNAYFPKQAFWRDGVTVRSCKACLAAGGERRRWAKLCKGRRGGRSVHCTFGQSVMQAVPLPTSDADEAIDLERPQQTPATPRHSHCIKCEQAGGIRAERAETCKGRRQRQQCSFEVVTIDNLTRHTSAANNRSGIADRLPGDIDVTKLDPKRYHFDVNYTHEGTRIRSCAACNASGGLRKTRAAWCRGRWRVAQCTFVLDGNQKEDNDDADSLQSWSADIEGKYPNEGTVDSAHSSSMDVVAYPAATEYERWTRSYSIQDLRPTPSLFPSSSLPALSSPQSSLPPSSPPIFDASESTFYRVSFRPTPSPSTSAPYSGSPTRPIRALPRTASSSRSLAAVRTQTLFAATPPSGVGLKDLSVSYDAPLSLTRRGILRQPTDFDRPSPARSLKRARFSLVPLSPPLAPSSPSRTPLEGSDLDDEDELLLAPSPPIRAVTHQPAWRPASALRSSSPRSTELDVRAKDVGLKLSEHTGRLSSGMLAAFAPASAILGRRLSNTLVSSLRNELTSHLKSPTEQYSLPTPPPSFGSSRGSDRSATPNRSPKSSLMLPPPVPLRATSTHRLPTPVSAEEEESSDFTGSSRKRLVMPHQKVTGRSRAKSLGALPKSTKDPRPSSFTPKTRKSAMAASTPRKRRRTSVDEEEELQRASQEEGMEWGMDEDAGEELSRSFRDSSVFHFVD